MNSWRIGTAVSGAGLSVLLCMMPVSAAYADTPRSWESRALGLSSAQRVTQGEGIKVAVLDTGVVKDHPALAGKVTTGADFVKDESRPGDPGWGDHGTAMASDVLKVAPRAHILSVRAIDEKGHSPALGRHTTPITEGIDYALKHDADVISMSMGGDSFGNSFDERETKALARASHARVPVVASAGNDAEVLNDSIYPAAYPGVIAVAAVQEGGKRAEFSTVRTYNAVAAPGVDIVSAKNTGGYELVDGTSPAAALTSGVVALMLAENKKLSPAQVRSILAKTATHPPGGPNPLVGHGTINAAAAVRSAARPPADGTAAASFEGKKHLAKPNGVSPTQQPPLDTVGLTVGLIAAVVGLGMVIVAIRIFRVGGRRGAVAAATGPAGAVGYVYPPGQAPGYGIPQQQPTARPQQPPYS
ncbi:Serine protease, subtilisin family [Streptomyces sp. WMMB 714]|uniref:S8 family peptidase n=1 Tax=Streptomyces sp. WMMB 714 TaxID=1286822 RepID=UPI000823DDE5|nr:S8 family serine peptidase [Streptomyces sp. WMMB 714]SCK56656.1 Serine protease, subtilisin family [Streptomyces sp. WMMB 714]